MILKQKHLINIGNHQNQGFEVCGTVLYRWNQVILIVGIVINGRACRGEINLCKLLHEIQFG